MSQRYIKNPARESEMSQEHYLIQGKFVAEYVATCDKVKAARVTGYKGKAPGKRADEILCWPDTRRLIEEELEGFANERKVTKRWLLNRLFETHDMAVSQEHYKAQDVLKVLTAIAEHCGLTKGDLEDNEVKVFIQTFADGKRAPVPKDGDITGDPNWRPVEKHPLAGGLPSNDPADYASSDED